MRVYLTGTFIFLLTLCSCGTKTNWKNHFIGDWESKSGSGVFHEVWADSKKGLFGRGFEMNKEGDTIFSEKLKLEERGETLVYTAWPGGQRMVEFTGKMQEEGRYVFVNTENDFPSEIEYFFKKEYVDITLIGTQGGDKTKETFKLWRSKK